MLRATARDALQTGYGVVVVSEGNRTSADEEHDATLMILSTIFGDLMDPETWIGLVKRSPTRAAA